MGLDNNDDDVSLPYIENAKGLRRIRYRLIKWLAHDEPVVINTIMVTPPGWAIGRQSITGGLIVHNRFVLGLDYEFVPDSRLLWRNFPLEEQL